MTERCIVVHVDADLEDLVPGYLANRRADIDALRERLEREDLEPARITGHSMKGTGAGYGFEEITRIGAAIEQAAAAGDRALLGEQIDRLEDYLTRVEVVYD